MSSLALLVNPPTPPHQASGRVVRNLNVEKLAEKDGAERRRYKAWYRRNRQAHMEASRANYAAKRESILAQKRVYYLRNRARILAKVKARYYRAKKERGK